MIDHQQLQAFRAAKRAADLQRQADSRIVVRGWTIQDAIGSTGGAANVGVEVFRHGETTNYFSNRTEAMAWIEKQALSPVENCSAGHP